MIEFHGYAEVLENQEVPRILVHPESSRLAETVPDGFVLVPLDWDHPRRELQLRRAAAGLEPPADSDEDREDTAP